MTEIYLAENHLLLKTGYGNPEMHSHFACHVLVGLQPDVRSERLSLQEFAQLSNLLL